MSPGRTVSVRVESDMRPRGDVYIVLSGKGAVIRLNAKTIDPKDVLDDLATAIQFVEDTR